MLPKWFNEWNEKNPTNVFGPAILVGAAGAAVFVAAMLVNFGQPFKTDTLQTGPRGTGMGVPEFQADLAASYPDADNFYTTEPIVPEANARPIRIVRANAEPTLGYLTPENYDRLVEAMRIWTGIPDLFAGEENYQTVVARNMIEMTQNINEFWGGHVNANAEVGVTCYTCHRGQPVPNNIWFEVSPVNENAGGWSANQNRVTMVSNSTSLPSDYLETYLLLNEDGQYNRIGVHDLASRVQQMDGDPLIQHAERTYAFMNYIANSLGVNCTFCHNTRAFYDAAQVTPQWATATLGIQMVQEALDLYVLPLADVLPAERLGPVHGDVPKLACRTCHQGQQRPLRGLNVIANWPELATTSGEPDYSAFQ